MKFDQSHRPDYSKLPAPMQRRAIATFLRRREEGNNVQFVTEKGKLDEWSFNSEERRDAFITKLARDGVDCITSDCAAFGREG